MIATAVLAADYAGTFELFDTSRIGARATQPAPIVDNPRPGRLILAGDASTTATARLHVNDRRWDYTLGYSPALSVTDFELGIAPQVLQTGIASVSLRERFVQVLVSEAASYGDISNAVPFQQPVVPAGQQVQTPATTGQPVPPGQTGQMGQTVTPGMAAATGPLLPNPGTLGPQTFAYFSSDTQGSVALSERRVALSVGGGYHRGGGLGQRAQAYLPEQFGPRAYITVSYAASRQDTVTTLATAQNTTTPSGPCFPAPIAPSTSTCRTEAPSAQLEELVQSRLNATTALSVGAGAAVAVEVTEAGERVLVIDPVGIASVLEQLDARRPDVLGVSIQLAPQVDLITGTLSERIQAMASLSTQVSPSIVLIGSAGILKSIDIAIREGSPIVALTGSLEARVRISREVDVGLGAQAFWENQPRYPPPIATETGYVNVTARVPTLDF